MPNIEVLKKQVLLEGLTDKELELILKNTVKLQFQNNALIFKEGDPTTGIYMIAKGKVEIKRTLHVDAKQKMLIMLRNIHSKEIRHTSHGWDHVFADLDTNDFFGELSILEGKKQHGAEAVALGETELYRISIENLHKLEEKHPAIMGHIMRTIAKTACRNVRRLDKRLFDALIGK